MRSEARNFSHASFHLSCDLETKHIPTIMKEIHVASPDETPKVDQRSSFVACLRACLVRRCQGFTLTSSRVLVRWTRLPPTDAKGLTPLHCALMPPKASAYVSSPRDWAVSIGWQMQQEMVLFWGASITQRAFPSVRAVCRRHLVGKLAVTARRTQLSSVSVHHSWSHAPLGDLWKAQNRHHCVGPMNLSQYNFLEAGVPTITFWN